ncbi:MAG: hypothetical protein ABII96_04885 [Candidatus Zixiibacteriota bacterium]
MNGSISLVRIPDRPDSHLRDYIFIVFAGLVVFSPSLFHSFVSDDFYWISRGTNLSFKDLFHNFEGASYNRFRPLHPFFFSVLYRFFGLSPLGYHLSSILIHVFNALLFYRLILYISLKKEIALLATVIFVTHFANEETVFWISSNCVLCSWFFSLLCILTFLEWLKRKSLWFYFLSLGTATIAFFFREDALVLPLILLLLMGLELLRSKQEIRKDFNHSSSSTSILSLAPFFLLVLVYLYLRSISLSDLYFASLISLNPINAIRNFAYFLFNLTLPLRLIFDVLGYQHSQAINSTVNSIDSNWLMVVASLLVVTFSIPVIWLWFRKASNDLKQLVVMFIILLLPCLFTKGYGLRFTYMPLLGFAPLSSYLLLHLIKRINKYNRRLEKHYIFVALIIIIILNFLILFERQRWWREASRICQETITHAGTVMSSLPEGSTVCFMGLPVRSHGAYIFNNGFIEAMSLYYPSYNSAITVEDSNEPGTQEEEVVRNHHEFKYDNGEFFQLF